jgi:hypothetical protein
MTAKTSPRDDGVNGGDGGKSTRHVEKKGIYSPLLLESVNHLTASKSMGNQEKVSYGGEV